MIQLVGFIAMTIILSTKVTFAIMKEYAKRPQKRMPDVGMLNFCVSTVFFSWVGIPLGHISPLYFADPMGAIVGKNIKTPKIPYGGKKTFGGTFAVIFTAFVSLVFFA